MRSTLHHRPWIVLLSAILGWIGGGEGRAAASPDPVFSAGAPRPISLDRGSVDGRSKQGQSTTSVQAAPGNPVAVISTSLGDITIELFKDRAPVSVENFLQYAVFGRVLSGMDVADRIAAVPTRAAGDMEDVPVDPVIIKSVHVQK